MTDFAINEVTKMTQNLNPNKPHGHHIIGRFAFLRFINLIYKVYIEKDIFLSEWKKVNLVTVHNKNDDKQSLETYCC